MDRKYFCTLLIAALVFFTCIPPASAALQEVTLKGTVSTLIPGQNSFSIENPSRYGCDYPVEGAPVCTFTKISSMTVTGTAPNSMAFSIFHTGDAVIARSIGGTGGTWIALAKLFGPDPGQEYVTDLIGDPAAFPLPMAGNYSLDIRTTPDCTSCSGTTCTAASAGITVFSGGLLVAEKTLAPKQSFTYSGRNDGSDISVTFVKGEASSGACAGARTGLTGPQPQSIFIISIVPPIGFDPTAVAVTAPIETGEAAATPLAETTRIPTTKAPLQPQTAILALIIPALVMMFRKL